VGDLARRMSEQDPDPNPPGLKTRGSILTSTPGLKTRGSIVTSTPGLKTRGSI